MKAVPTDKFKRFLKKKGLVHQRTSASHEVWNNPDKPYNRPIIFRGSKKEVPQTHLRTILLTLGMDAKEFQEIIKDC
jgi:predicted RNA binding protein YcfA (HicA-like mRNA interferase family)